MSDVNWIQAKLEWSKKAMFDQLCERIQSDVDLWRQLTGSDSSRVSTERAETLIVVRSTGLPTLEGEIWRSVENGETHVIVKSESCPYGMLFFEPIVDDGGQKRIRKIEAHQQNATVKAFPPDETIPVWHASRRILEDLFFRRG